jgi:hypothetical protein
MYVHRKGLKWCQVDTLLSSDELMRKERPTPRFPKAKQTKILLTDVKITLPLCPAGMIQLDGTRQLEPGENTLSVQPSPGASLVTGAATQPDRIAMATKARTVLDGYILLGSRLYGLTQSSRSGVI